ncbi:hypothetical protein [Gemmata sp. SH-PL17]|uniref:hypothetical protein n=1 Tax=Gemmata sp. SH-PL17 TaxID=1630693 RepID=UPI0012F7C4DB|nr:hypothetical protein [Gemmata sp. SH-PL17]
MATKLAYNPKKLSARKNEIALLFLCGLNFGTAYFEVQIGDALTTELTCPRNQLPTLNCPVVPRLSLTAIGLMGNHSSGVP